jgi:UDP-2-acetamido-2,6-beta-L-arabino-hexul-4-ose reductase
MITSVLVTGAKGFIGRNLALYLRANRSLVVNEVTRGTSRDELAGLVAASDVVVHLAGVNRPTDVDDFHRDNVDFTQALLDVLTEVRPIPVIYISSIQANLDNPYGTSKRIAENLVRTYGKQTGNRVSIVRLPNVFGKWCRPNYNSVVATFVHNVSRGIELRVDDPNHVIDLAYIDDVLELIFDAMTGEILDDELRPHNVYRVSVGELAETVRSMHRSRSSREVLDVGAGFLRALYSTYVSALEPSDFSYDLNPHVDPRGTFTEVLRTPVSGQLSYLTAVPGATRGSHYHHSKIEKFVVVSGSARFRFRCLLDNRTHEVFADSTSPRVVESVPGWAHDITNVGLDELVVLIWANEVFDEDRPDTYPEVV